MAEEDLKKAINLAKSGNKRDAVVLLSQIVKAEPTNEVAWLWLASCVGKDDQKIFCIKKALAINPNNPRAQQALQRLENPIPSVDEMTSNIAPIRPQTGRVDTHKPSVRRRKRWSLLFTIGLVSILVLVCIVTTLNFANNRSDPGPTSESRIDSPTKAADPTSLPILIVEAGELSTYKDQITRDRVINVYKKNGTIDQREDDLKELCLDWVYYREKIIQYQSEGKTEKVAEAQASMQKTNAWLDEYNENDVQTMLAWAEENGWRFINPNGGN